MRYRYSIDNSNRLSIKPRNLTKPLITDGKFEIDRNNRLVYWLNEPDNWRKQYDLANRISFVGNWRLDSNCDFELYLSKAPNQYKGDALSLKGEIVSVERDELIFEIHSLDKQGQNHIRLLRLSGLWQADECNRISFIVAKKPSPDILTLEGAWQLNKNQQITYTYEKVNLKTKTKFLRTLTFTGFWQINNANRLTYILSKSSNSRFDFRVQIESPNLYPRQGVIKYRLGIGLKEQKPARIKVISLYGTWKFSRKLGLVFQMDYGKGEIHNIEFGVDISLSKRDEIAFALKNKREEPLGFNITFTHRFLKKLDAEAFLRLKKTLRSESAIEAGVRIPF
jgi:hypothetical protein